MFIELHARRRGRADNTNYIGYMGPNEAAKQFIDPEILADPTVNPDAAPSGGSSSCSISGADEVKYGERYNVLRRPGAWRAHDGRRGRDTRATPAGRS